MHRIRCELIAHRTAKANQIWGLVSEYGLVAPKQMYPLRREIPNWLEDAENGLSSLFRRLLHGLCGDLKILDQRVEELDREFELIADGDEDAKRLQKLRGVGPMIATALVAAVGSAEHFARGRQIGVVRIDAQTT